MVLIEEAFQLLFVAVFIGVNGKRNTAGATRFPMNGLLAHRGLLIFIARIMRKSTNFVNRNLKIMFI
jgi:hypothetical protein